MNAADTESCATCGFKAIASGAEIDRARAAWRLTGSIHGHVPEYESNKYRTFWPRFWAGVIDALVLWPLGWINAAIWAATSSPAVLVPWWVLYSFSWVAYSIVLHGNFGQTLGKRITGVKVLDLSETRLSMRQAVLRDSVPALLIAYGLISELPMVADGRNPYARTQWAAADLVLAFGGLAWFVLELVTMLSNDKRRAVHDFIAGSVVVRMARRPEQIHGQSAPS